MKFLLIFFYVALIPNLKANDRYYDEIQPILDKRCVACHACYDSPCSLKLTSYEGLQRGAKNVSPYGVRKKSMEPIRLFKDAFTETSWREKGFWSVLPRKNSTSSQRLDSSILSKVLELGQIWNTPDQLEDFKMRKASQCENEPEDFKVYSWSGKPKKSKQKLGMPFGLPHLNQEEHQTIKRWIADGAPGPSLEAQQERQTPSRPSLVKSWEDFLNEEDLKSQWMAKYLYEHLYLGHIHLEEAPGEYYELVRSYTASPAPIKEIVTLFPYDSPKTQRPYYRLRRIHSTIVHKTHIVQRWSLKEIEHYRRLFLEADWGLEKIPQLSWDNPNPFVNFKPIPPRIRYRWLIENSKLMIDFFTRGPVCNGSVATNVVRDHFWIFFMQPSSDVTATREFYELKDEDGMTTADLLQLPALDDDDNHEGLYRKRARRYEKIHASVMRDRFLQKGLDLNDVWDGDGIDPNAMLTVLRHEVNVTVHHGQLGGLPKTAWVLNYSIFERIYYDLVASFNVYGDLKHKMNTRKYMDNLRMESEDLFLVFLNPKQRKQLRDQWYNGKLNPFVKDERKKFFMEGVKTSLDLDVKKTFLRKLTDQRLLRASGGQDRINDKDLYFKDLNQVESQLRQISHLKGKFVQNFKDVSYLIIENNNGQKQVYSIVRNNDHKSMNKIWLQKWARNRENDTLQVFLDIQFAYPNQIFVVKENQLNQFVQQVKNMKDSKKHYQGLVDRFGIRKKDIRFWKIYDFLNLYFKKKSPIESGLIDLNLYGANAKTQ